MSDGAVIRKKQEIRKKRYSGSAPQRKKKEVMRLIKTLHQAIKMDRERFKVPRSVQQAIPIQRIRPDGIFQHGTKFSKSFRFSDINYAIASKEDKTEMFLDYSELLNALDSGASAKITLNNRRVNKKEFEASLLIPMKEDGLDEYRREYMEVIAQRMRCGFRRNRQRRMAGRDTGIRSMYRTFSGIIRVGAYLPVYSGMTSL